jgi:hypothetical protein
MSAGARRRRAAAQAARSTAIIQRFAKLWPKCFVVRARPRHPQTAPRQAARQRFVPDRTGRQPVQQTAGGSGAMTAALRVDLAGDERCTAGAVSVTAHTPLLALCRTLLANGFDPTTRLEAYRGDTLCLLISSIKAAAALTVAETGTRFVAWRPFPASAVSPRIAPNRRGASWSARHRQAARPASLSHGARSGYPPDE